MKIIFAATPFFALPTLEALLNSSKYEVLAIITQPDRPAGRGKKLTSSPIKDFAIKNKLPLLQPKSLKKSDIDNQIEQLNPDLLVDVACGFLVPENILKLPKFGTINIHPSLLPQWRGAAPVQRAILAGDKVTGVTIMQMDAGLDTGPIYQQQSLEITKNDTTATLLEKTAHIGATLLLKTIADIEQGTAELTPQNNQKATYAHKLTKEEGKIDWRQTAKELERKIRAFNPWPIAFTEIDQKNIRIWQASVTSDNQQPLANNPPGTIVQFDKTGIYVQTGEGLLQLLKIQLPGKNILAAPDIFNAYKNSFKNNNLFQ